MDISNKQQISSSSSLSLVLQAQSSTCALFLSTGSSTAFELPPTMSNWHKHIGSCKGKLPSHSSSRTTNTCNSLLTQTLIVHLLRTAKFPIIQSRAAPILVFSTASIMAIGFVLPWIPAFRPAFSFAQPAPTFVGFLAAELLLYAVEVQVVKIIYIKIFCTWL